MVSSKPQCYYICLLKASMEASGQSQSLVGACTKVTKLILFVQELDKRIVFDGIRVAPLIFAPQHQEPPFFTPGFFIVYYYCQTYR